MSDAESAAIQVFIVEDHAAVRQMMEKLIEKTPGFTLSGSAASAEETLEKIPAARPHLVLVDVSLPGMDGIELIRVLHERWPEILTLAVSGHNESLYAPAALQAGARGYVMKGKVLQVAEAIRHVCNGGLYISDRLREDKDLRHLLNEQ